MPFFFPACRAVYRIKTYIIHFFIQKYTYYSKIYENIFKNMQIVVDKGENKGYNSNCKNEEDGGQKKQRAAEGEKL